MIVKIRKFAIFLKCMIFNTPGQRMGFAGTFLGVAFAGVVRGELPFVGFLIIVAVGAFSFLAGRRYEANKVVQETGTWWNYDFYDGSRARFTDHVIAVEGLEEVEFGN